MKIFNWKSVFFAKIASIWMRSLRIKIHLPKNFRPGVLGLWHKDLLACTAAFKDKGVHVLVSESDDGKIFSEAARQMAYKVTSGSDSHGSSNVRHSLKTLQDGGFAGMALDGPHGPALAAKPGSLWLAKSSHTPLWHLQPRYGHHIRLKSWDNFVIPLPLTSIDIKINYFCCQSAQSLFNE